MGYRFSITYYPIPTFALNNINAMKRALLTGRDREPYLAVKATMRRTEQNVLAHLKRFKRSELTSYDNPPSGFITNVISSNIDGTFRVWKERHMIFGGVGDVGLLDQQDPMKMLENPARGGNHQLWRVLEYGTAEHFILPHAKGQGSYEKQHGKLKYFDVRKGHWVLTDGVMHPGTKAKKFFATAAYTLDLIFLEELQKYMKMYASKWSYKRGTTN